MSDTPAPLSADSLHKPDATELYELIDVLSGPYGWMADLERLIAEYTAAALQAERQRIADGLPEKRLADLWDDSYEEGKKDGHNAAIQAVRAVLIPPRGGKENHGDSE